MGTPYYSSIPKIAEIYHGFPKVFVVVNGPRIDSKQLFKQEAVNQKGQLA